MDERDFDHSGRDKGEPDEYVEAVLLGDTIPCANGVGGDLMLALVADVSMR